MLTLALIVMKLNGTDAIQWWHIAALEASNIVAIILGLAVIALINRDVE